MNDRKLEIVLMQLLEPSKRDKTWDMVKEALQQPDLVHFTMAIITNASHGSKSDRRVHATALLATDEQWENHKCQVLHVYHDKEYIYTDHQLIDEVIECRYGYRE